MKLIKILFPVLFLLCIPKAVFACGETSIWDGNIPYCDGNDDGSYTGSEPCEPGCCGKLSPGGFSVGCGCCGGSCFLPDTKIATPGGQQFIKDIKVGNKVTSINPQTGIATESEVLANYETLKRGYYELKVELPDGSHKVLKVTGEHPLYRRESSFFFWLFTSVINFLKIK